MVVTLIVIGVIAFLAIDAYIIYRVVAARRSADDYGTLAVPGEVSLTLPAGKLKLTYQESYRASRSGDSIEFGVPSGLAVAVSSPTGEPLEIEGPGFRGMGSSVSTGKGWSRAMIGTVEIPQPGVYTVSARTELADLVEPLILFGK